MNWLAIDHYAIDFAMYRPQLDALLPQWPN